jgi:two-component system response regulator FixJ
MVNNERPHIFFVDDEPKMCEVVGGILKELSPKVSCFTNAADCLKKLDSQRCDLVITDVKMPGMDGIELLEQISRSAPWLPVMIITGYGDIPMAVRAVKAGAKEFAEKPLDKKKFLQQVKSIMQQSHITDSYIGKPLTQREKRVLKLIISGKTNREIAHLLHRSIRTIEVHRNHIMHKLAVENVVDLVKRTTLMGLVELQVNR